MLDDITIEKAREKLTIGPRVPDDGELMDRYLGKFDSLSDLARALFRMDSPHIPLDGWPYRHIDWGAATEAVMGGNGIRNFVEVDGHWFDALAKPVRT